MCLRDPMCSPGYLHTSCVATRKLGHTMQGKMSNHSQCGDNPGGTFGPFYHIRNQYHLEVVVVCALTYRLSTVYFTISYPGTVKEGAFSSSSNVVVLMA